MIVFACLTPHAPIFLPDIGSETDRDQVRRTITTLTQLGQKMAVAKPDCLIITSPHPDWGIEVPLHFLSSKLKMKNEKLQFKIQNYQTPDSFIRNLKLEIRNYAVFPILTTLDSPKSHFQRGKEIVSQIPKKLRWAWIASGDMSHRLKKDGPYGLHPSGEKFDQKFMSLLKKKDISAILNLDPILIEEAGECGLRSFCMLLGALEESQVKWQPKILSYESPFGVGYLVSQLV